MVKIILMINIFNKIFTSGHVPYHFKSAVIFVLLLLLKGDRDVVSNYRGISFINNIAKVFTSLLLEKLIRWA